MTLQRSSASATRALMGSVTVKMASASLAARLTSSSPCTEEGINPMAVPSRG